MSPFTDLPYVLAIDDDESYLRLLERTLVREGLRVSTVTSGGEGIRQATSPVPDVILLDIVMPEMDGYEVCRRLKEDPATRDIPVIFMTAEARDDEHVAQAFSVGACGYITKPFSRIEILTRVRSIIQQRYESMYVQRLQMHDDLTGLPNRRYFVSHADEELAEAARYDTPVTLVLARLDGLEEVSDNYGAEAELTLVRRFAMFLRSELRRHDTVARWDSSRFTLLLPRIPLEGGTAAARRMFNIWRRTAVTAEGAEIRTAAGFGIVSYLPHEEPTTAGALIEQGELALDQARDSDGICAVHPPANIEPLSVAIPTS